MKAFTLRNTRLILLILTGSALGQSCKEEVDPLPPDGGGICGDKLQWASTLDIDSDILVSKVENGFRIFKLEDLGEPLDICTDENCTANFKVKLTQSGGSSDMVFSAYANWSTMQKTELISYDNIDDIYNIDLDLSLKEAFPGKPGFVGLQLHIKFPTKGSLDADKAYLKANIGSMKIGLDYNKYKSE